MRSPARSPEPEFIWEPVPLHDFRIRRDDPAEDWDTTVERFLAQNYLYLMTSLPNVENWLTFMQGRWKLEHPPRRRFSLLGLQFGPWEAPAHMPDFLFEYEALLTQHRKELRDWSEKCERHQAMMRQRQAAQVWRVKLERLKSQAHSQRKRPV